MKDGRELSHEVLETYRLRAIELRQAGKKVKDIAFFFGLHPASVSRWFVKYRKKGKHALKSTKAPGPAPKLTIKEAKHIIRCLKKPATEYGFSTPLWTCKRVRKVIQEEASKRYTSVGAWKFLRRFGLTNKSPEKRAIEQNPKEAKRWVKEEWPKIKAHAKRWQAVLYFQDEAGVSLIPVKGKTWAPKGITPIVRLTGNRGGFCLSSAISTGGRLIFRIEKGRVVKETFIDFLDKIRSHHNGRKVIVITDRAPPHRAALVKTYVDKHKKNFALYFLPAYSSELNPDEHVWAYLKDRKLKTHTATSVPELKRLTLSSMQSIQRQRMLVKSFFYGELFNTS